MTTNKASLIALLFWTILFSAAGILATTYWSMDYWQVFVLIMTGVTSVKVVDLILDSIIN